MFKQYRVVDCRSPIIQPDDHIVAADTPEQAARLVLGEDLVRGSQGNKMIRARVYSDSVSGIKTMVRLYAPVASRR
ncbi:MAG: hypothetical protein JWP26_2522 [Devosia sp.]|uniref:hypothetical protein n=1 Tax=Devosia sp. TaxID=1871048 RepID=UPI0026031CBC|nr:hypothetical protein [Devosia sp.]MDB5538184.1 hypothetical protein [Devosia sp.]MDB5587552.1 hypothetical protein [Devosia sp.]